VKTKMMMLIDWAGGSKAKLARLCGTTRQNVNRWVRTGRVPKHWAIKIEKMSDGQFKAIELNWGDTDVI
jgi:hypothetical protein